LLLFDLAIRQPTTFNRNASHPTQSPHKPPMTSIHEVN
jgi:hypothetical protein